MLAFHLHFFVCKIFPSENKELIMLFKGFCTKSCWLIKKYKHGMKGGWKIYEEIYIMRKCVLIMFVLLLCFLVISGKSRSCLPIQFRVSC